jgi:copper chaperone
MKHEFKIEGMSCGHCVMAVKKELGNLSGIESMDVQIGSAVVETTDAVTREQLAAAIEEAGYTLSA